MKILSLFSGIGAFEKALKNLNTPFEVVNYCEIDKFASCAYSAIHEVSEDLNLGDITKVKTENITDFGLVTYGFPCQDISLAGKMHGIVKGKTRSGLLYEALRIIKDKKPKYAIAENVKNLVSKRFINDFNSMIKELDNLGYNSYWQVLNAKNYGAYQSRERVFIVSIRKDIDNNTFKFPETIKNSLTLNNIVEENIPDKYYCNGPAIRQFIRNINSKIADHRTPSKFGLLKVGDIQNPSMLDMNKRVFSTEGLSPTLVTGSDSVPKIVQCRVRKLMPIECWRITGFTDEDYFKAKTSLEESFYKGKDMSTSQMYKMAGNSICVPVLESILKNLLKL